MKKRMAIIISFMLSCGLYAQINVQDIEYKDLGNKNGLVGVNYTGKLNGQPELMIRDSIVQLSIPEAIVWPKIDKKISVVNRFDSTLTAYQFDQKTVRIRAILPYNFNAGTDQLQLKVRDGRIEFQIPRTEAALSSSKDASKYDESYLMALLKDKKESGNEGSVVVTSAVTNDFNQAMNNSKVKEQSDKDKAKEDTVKGSFAGLAKIQEKTKDSFSFGKYIAKFVAFLALVLVAFYAVVHMMKKGVLKKGKLGFLNNMKPVKVLSTTFIGPKRSILTVQAHNQIFLIGSSEKGIHFLSEIRDVTGLLKEGEKSVAGDNFDTNILVADSLNVPQKIKENIHESTENEPGLQAFLDRGMKTEDSEKKGNNNKLSEKIKSRVKELKSLQ